MNSNRRLIEDRPLIQSDARAWFLFNKRNYTSADVPSYLITRHEI
jgi:hypothetical protein